MFGAKVKAIKGNFLVHSAANLLRDLDSLGILFKREVQDSIFYCYDTEKPGERGLKISIKFDHSITIPPERERLASIEYIFIREYGTENVSINSEYLDTKDEAIIFIELDEE